MVHLKCQEHFLKHMECPWVMWKCLRGELVPQYPYLLVVAPLVVAQAHIEATLYPAAPPILEYLNTSLHRMLVSWRSSLTTQDQGPVYNYYMLDLYGKILQQNCIRTHHYDSVETDVMIRSSLLINQQYRFNIKKYNTLNSSSYFYIIIFN